MPMRVVLIPCAPSDWCEDGRLLGRTELALSERGIDRISDWIGELSHAGVSRLFHSPDELATMTASTLAKALRIPAKPAEELQEVDLGLWAGLTETELKSRFAKAHRELNEAPLNVSPPGGEEVAVAAERIKNELKKRLKPSGKHSVVGLVMRPLMLALARAALGETEPHEIWKARQLSTPIVIEPDQSEPALVGSTAE
jgi:broad specificity phosphatase PhoE